MSKSDDIKLYVVISPNTKGDKELEKEIERAFKYSSNVWAGDIEKVVTDGIPGKNKIREKMQTYLPKRINILLAA